MRLATIALAICASAGCATVVSGNERALFYSASGGLAKTPVNPGWYWHLPWNHYVTYDMRWKQHQEEIHIHTVDGLHLNVVVAVVVRPKPGELYDLDISVGPGFYDQIVRPAVFAASRDASGKFKHLDVATKTHEIEAAIRASLVEHLAGQHLEIGEVAIQHFDLPPEIEQAANRTAAASMLIAAKDVDLQLAGKDIEVDKAKRRGVIEAEGLDIKLRGEQELAHQQQLVQVEQARRAAAKELAEAEAEQQSIRAEGDAKAIRIRASADKERILAQSKALTPDYIRLQAVDALAKALSGPNEKIFVLPSGKDGLPGFFSPFLNPFAQASK